MAASLQAAGRHMMRRASRTKKLLLIASVVLVTVVASVLTANWCVRKRLDGRLDAVAERLGIPDAWTAAGAPERVGDGGFVLAFNPRGVIYTWETSIRPSANELQHALGPIGGSYGSPLPDVNCHQMPIDPAEETASVPRCEAYAIGHDAYVTLTVTPAEGNYLIKLGVYEG